MMKKIISLMTIFVSFTFCISTVSARGELIYDITDMVVSDTAVVFKGWAEINDYHNYGGTSTIIKIFAMKKGDTNESNWVSANITYNSQYDTALYQANCMRYSGVGKPCVESHDQATCDPAKLNSTSSCRYDNVGFTATLMLDKLYEELGEDDEITFKIRVSNTSGGTQTEDLGVFSGNCNVSNGETVSGSQYSITVSDLANSGRIVTNQARVIQNESGAYARGSSFKWIGNAVYQIIERRISNSVNIKGLSMYSLYYGTPNGSSCFDTSSINGRAQNSGSCIGYAYGTWLDIEGNVSIKLSAPEPQNCLLNENKSLQCEDGTFDSSCNESVNAGTVYAEGEGGCPGGRASVTATVNIKQTGVLSFSLERGPIYSGGGFTFSSTYENEASWDYTSGGYRGCPNVTIEYKTRCPKLIDGETFYVDCCREKQVKSPECETNSDYENFINRAMSQKYVGLSNSSAVVSMPDSNDVNGPINDDTGTWDCTNDNVGSSWEPNTTLHGSCTFTLYNAYIDKKTSEAVYGNYGGNGYLSEGQKYFVPLKFPTGIFNVSASFNGLSSIINMNWSATYDCGVNCEQKLYDLDDGGYLYYFRPISLSEPFPNGREIGINWVDWIADRENQERLLETYTTDNNLEYTVILSSSDIANIKKYNYNANYSGGKGYLDLEVGNNFDVNGNSSFIKTYNYFTLGNVNHSGLGVFDPEDDMQ